MNTFEKLQLLKSGKMTAEQNVKQFLAAVEKDDQRGKKINAFIAMNPSVLGDARRVDEKIKKGKAGRLAGLVVAVKSNISVLGLKTSCASKVLENYFGSYDATVIKKIREEDGIIIGMTNMDEFACGSSGETSAFGATQNPAALGKVPGGSSSGSAASVAAGFCDLSLGTDTGGSIRNPASHCSVVGVKPSYASVSRYGLIDLSMSLDQIGTFSKDVYGSALLLDVIRGKDAKDSISQDSKRLNLDNLGKTGKNITVGVLDLKISDDRIKKLIDLKIDTVCKKYGWKIKKIKIDFIDLAVETYYPLVYVEFFSGTRKFNGRLFGKKIEDHAGVEVLRRILGGSEITKAEFGGRYYNRALKAKRIFGNEFAKVFKDVDCVIIPTVPRLPHKIGEKISVEDMYKYDALTIPSNLAGNCSLSVPAGKIDNIPVGLQVICDVFQDEKMFGVASTIEKLN